MLFVVLLVHVNLIHVGPQIGIVAVHNRKLVPHMSQKAFYLRIWVRLDSHGPLIAV